MENPIQKASGGSISEKCVVSALDFWSDPWQQRSVEDIYESIYSPVASLGDTPTSAEFYVPGKIVLNSTLLIST